MPKKKTKKGKKSPKKTVVTHVKKVLEDTEKGHQ